MILYDFRCPIDDQVMEAEDLPLFYGGLQACEVGKHLHASANQTLECANGHRWKLESALLLSREA